MDNTVLIPLGKSGKSAIVDEVDYQWLNRWKWQYSNRGYALRVTNVGGRVKNGGKQVSLLMHREIIKPEEELYIDHINGNKLDNRRINLRIATPTQNVQNMKIQIGRNTSGFKGVSWCKRDQKYLAYIRINGRLTWLGRYDNTIDAALAYNVAAKKHFGQFAKLNDITH